MLICPLPTAAQDHQTANAMALERAGAAIHIAQKDLSAERLDGMVKALLEDHAKLRALREHAIARARPHAAREIAAYILALLAQEAR